ncbi:MAG: aminotransferase class V-fold PLP-dependent enzyme [Planctomycetes bacterium]|nr:aminotransferase class V-fold PLP-dependent enzyme [Planctomycetota bacterium]
MAKPQLALLGGRPLGPVKPDQHPRFTARAIARAVKLLEKGMTVGLGKHHPIIVEAEEAIARWQGVEHVMVLSSGHAALQMSLVGLEIEPGDEVITTPYSWGASTSCILHCGAIPVFTDALPDTGLMDPATIEPLITTRTRAILPVHIHGQPADMPAIVRVARRHGLAVVEDGSQAHGARVAGKRVGRFGDASGFSCMGFKLLGTTEAGYLATPHEDLYWKAALCCQHMGRSPDPGFPKRLLPFVDSLVFSYRLSPVTAVLLTEQIKKVDREIDGRRRNVARLRGLLRGSSVLSFPAYRDDEVPSYYTLSMNFDAAAAGVRRETFQKALAAEKVEVGSYVPAPIAHWERLKTHGYAGPKTIWTKHLQAAGADYRSQRFPGCEAKIKKSLDMDWNYIGDDPGRMRRLADVFLKVEEGLPALRDWERRQDRQAPAAARKARPSRREVLA